MLATMADSGKRVRGSPTRQSSTQKAKRLPLRDLETCLNRKRLLFDIQVAELSQQGGTSAAAAVELEELNSSSARTQV